MAVWAKVRKASVSARRVASCATIILGALSAAPQSKASDSQYSLFEEAETFRKSNRKAVVDITSIVAKHFFVGMDAEAAAAKLVNQGFVLHKIEATNEDPQALVGSRKLTEPTLSGAKLTLSEGIMSGFHDEVRVILDIVAGRVSAVSGTIIYRAL